jgi:hypothetical protein
MDANATRSVTRFLELVKQEFPDYATDNDQLVAAVVCLSHSLGALGAICLLKGGETRLNKMRAMVDRNIDATANKGRAAAGKHLGITDPTFKNKAN